MLLLCDGLLQQRRLLRKFGRGIQCVATLKTIRVESSNKIPLIPLQCTLGFLQASYLEEFHRCVGVRAHVLHGYTGFPLAGGTASRRSSRDRVGAVCALYLPRIQKHPPSHLQHQTLSPVWATDWSMYHVAGAELFHCHACASMKIFRGLKLLKFQAFDVRVP